MKIFASTEDARRFVVVAVFVVAGLAALTVLVHAYAPFLTKGPALRDAVAEFGVLAPLALIAIHAVQVVVAPIPGQVVGFTSGYLFGTLPGTVYSLIGVTLGSVVAIWLSRRYGRPFVEDAIDDDVLTTFDGFVDRVGFVGLVFVFAIPGLPDDALCFLVGLTDVDLRTVVVAVILGRTPAYLLVNASGSSAASGDVETALVVLGLFVVLSAWAFARRERLLAAVENW